MADKKSILHQVLNVFMTKETFWVENRILTKLLVLVTLKKSSMRVCLLCPATDSASFLSSRLLSRALRNVSIRWRTLISLKTHQSDHSHRTLEEEPRGQSSTTHTWRVWHGRGSQPLLPHLARSRSVQQVLCPLYPETVFVLLHTSKNVALDGSNEKQILVSSLEVDIFGGIQRKLCPFSRYLSVHMQNDILNSAVLLDECEGSLRT